MSRIDETLDFIPVRIAVLTVSDTRDLGADRSGDTLVARLTEAGHTLADRQIIRDERALIADQLRVWIADPDVDVVISTGGTGLTGRDVTVEAHRDVYEKEIDAFGTIFTIVSMKRSAHQPFSPALRAVWPGAPTFLHCRAARGPARTRGTKSCNASSIIGTAPAILWKIMPRLDEHKRRK